MASRIRGGLELGWHDPTNRKNYRAALAEFKQWKSDHELAITIVKR